MDISSKKISADLRCIWMCAGIINYKLCDRDFQCEECEFNNVMAPRNTVDLKKKKEFLHEEINKSDSINFHLINGYLYRLFVDCTIHLDRYYHPSHFWFLPESENTVKVGINKILLKIISPIDKIILPKVDEICQKNELAGQIIRKGKSLPLYSPLQGKLIKVNNQFLKSAKSTMKDDGYCFKMEKDGIREKVQQLCGAIPRLEIFSKNLAIVKKYLEKTFNRDIPDNIGLTLADGGLFQDCLEKVIGETNFQDLLRELFPATRKTNWGSI